MRATHENLEREDDTKRSSNRSFGLVFAGVFMIVALWPLWSGAPVRLWAVFIAIAFGGLAFVVPGLLEWPNRLWQRVGMLLHHIVSPVALALVFYLAIMPTGLVMRLFGKDFLRLKRDPQAKSYWIERTPPGPAPDSMKNQF
jgi:O-antigen/teichoic acid export membrane protein